MARKPKKFYIVMEIHRNSHAILKDYLGQETKFPIDLGIVKGSVGVCPAFTNKRKAMRHAKGRQILTAETVDE